MNNLQILHMSNNMYITTCAPFAASLVELLCCGKSCNMGDSGLLLCKNLKILHADNNKNITTCAPFANSLIELLASGNSGISDIGISTCYNLTIISTYSNNKITTCAPFAKSLTHAYTHTRPLHMNIKQYAPQCKIIQKCRTKYYKSYAYDHTDISDWNFDHHIYQ